MSRFEYLRRLTAAERRVEREFAKARKRLGSLSIEETEALVRRGGKRRRPGDGSAPVMAEPPRGPLPKQGGAAAPLEFD